MGTNRAEHLIPKQKKNKNNRIFTKKPACAIFKNCMKIKKGYGRTRYEDHKTSHQSSGKSAGLLSRAARAFLIVSEAKGKTCTGVRIQVSQDQTFEKVIYDSGRMEKADSLGFPLPVPVEEGGRYYWRVEAWDDAGDHGISETACFELADINAHRKVDQGSLFPENSPVI